MKKEYWCQDCEGSFDIKFERGYEVLYCPFCGELLSDAHSNMIEEDD